MTEMPSIPPRRRGILSRLIFAASNLYLIALGIYFICRVILGSGVWWVALVNAFVVYTFVPAYVLAALAALAGMWRTVARLGIVILISVLWFGPFFQPKNIAPAKGVTVKVVTFNMWVEEENTSPENFIHWILENPVDVIVLQEVHDIYMEGIPELAEIYPEQTTGGVMLLSRYPILDITRYDRFFRAVLDIKGTEIAVYAVHLPYPFRFTDGRINLPFLNFVSAYDETRRNSQMEILIDTLEQETLPYIVAGDFNTSQHSIEYSKLAVVMNDSFRATNSGLGNTWSAAMPLPLLRLDYIWHSHDLRAIHTEIGPELGSDHLPLVATIEITDSVENVLME